MDCEDVTHEAILASHRKATLKTISQMPSTVLVLHDATEMDFTTHRSLEDLGQIGNGNHRGYIAQNSLAIDPETRQVLGLCHQVLHRRDTVPEKETIAEKRARESRESLLWLKGTAPLPANWKLVDVCDQGADTFEFLEHEVHSGRRFVIRAAYDRGILIGHGDVSTSTSSYLRTYATELPQAGRWTLSVTSKVDVAHHAPFDRREVIFTDSVTRMGQAQAEFTIIGQRKSDLRCYNPAAPPSKDLSVRAAATRRSSGDCARRRGSNAAARLVKRQRIACVSDEGSSPSTATRSCAASTLVPSTRTVSPLTVTRPAR